MGKKSRVKTQKSGTGATATVSPKEMLNLISELLQSKFHFMPLWEKGSCAEHSQMFSLVSETSEFNSLPVSGQAGYFSLLKIVYFVSRSMYLLVDTVTSLLSVRVGHSVF